jgi:phospholipid-transporting ATPase
LIQIANIYFLLLGILQIIPTISNSDGEPTIWAPLFLINLVTAAKKGYEDYKRKKSDDEENNSVLYCK